MRLQLPFAATLAAWLLACGGSSGGTPSARGFQFAIPEITLAIGEERTTCLYLHLPSSEPLPVRRWSSTMTAGVQRLELYATATDLQPPGTLSTEGCGAFTGGARPTWLYAAHAADEALVLPADDGAGKPLGQLVAAGAPAVVLLHLVNRTTGPLTARATISAEALPAGATYTATASYLAVAANISIPPGAIGHQVTHTCNVPGGATFWALSTSTHRRAVEVVVLDGPAGVATPLVTTTDWEHPTVQTWSAPFRTLASGKLTTRCTYDNSGPTTVTAGPDDATGEACAAIGYFFPATGSLLCVDGAGPL